MASKKDQKQAGAKKKAPAKSGAKKPAKKPAAQQKKPQRAKAKAGDKRKRKGPSRGKTRKRGKRLTAAQQGLRDTLMLTQKIRGMTWEEIAAEHKLGVSTVKERVERKRASLPKLLDQDAAKIIEGFVEELQVSIADFEAVAAAAMEGANLPVAVGAKRSANDARDQLRELLQSVGTLPHDLGTLTWVIDIRAVVLEINGAVEDFSKAVGKMDLPDDQRAQIQEAAGTVTRRLDEIADSPQTVTTSNGNGEESDGP